VLPSILIHLGVIDLSTAAPALASLFPAATAAAPSDADADRPAHTLSTTALLLARAAAPETTAPPARIGNGKGEERAAAAATATTRVPIPVDGPTPTPAQAYVLRAAAIEACERIVAHAHAMGAAGRGAPWLKHLTLPDLDIWLWAIAKDRPDYRALPRFALRNTPFF
jgi:hypothetical protein